MADDDNLIYLAEFEHDQVPVAERSYSSVWAWRLAFRLAAAAVGAAVVVAAVVRS